MSRVLIIGAGGVGRVVAHKCAQLPDVFSDICLASRTQSKCDQIASELNCPIQTAALNADEVGQTVNLIKRFRPDLVINVALPYQDLAIMDACLEADVDYLDTANYEPPDEARFEYKWQWAYQEKFKKAGRMALLGSGFDPGVTNVFCAYAQKHLFDEIEQVDILDCNAGDHGYPFATNFNPEINIREVTSIGRYWEEGDWKETPPLSVKRDFDFPEVGVRRAYLMYHEELESLALHLKGLKRIRFWMTFGESYLTHLRVLENVGMTGIKPVEFQGQQIVPLQFLKALLPDPASLGPRTKGKTCIGCLIDGSKDGKRRRVFIYNVCDHQACYEEVKSQAVSYTTGVPAMIGAKQILSGQWREPGVFNMEQLDPDPFMTDLNACGLPWNVLEMPVEEAES
ncbi:MAG: saccharopine dehydrogenase family protein [Verrucomicrobia bacterium]|nr:saccharopine dehydrogenase family protein [Verrucomicrobiota bacterium]MBT4274518.1 saccharopine dehydrogenase family protein [Verrucomicrobiota bacterium]MBT5062611.1 saccharopine dehydrogenase family protein [Verrucomicrobiota bacterium]MBT5479664.1 saccharopine dehydrogenase family protein [Verrucomicrobiota bacterium]MBT7873527.1 saccharopine dehydrogenase family protein [Verrucomicrobiota bacterium]